ncbi:nitronate monooxygenase [Aspergillus lucknowensis]|uniref:Nitronate monooxygenase domain-containing protein n=1 Tax=Aspergillus lucknowensis TaxID=176173 RepID=A0ABR4LQT6_9EURO
MSANSTLRAHYPWTKTPLVASAPMLNIATAPLSISVSEAGGLGFLAGGYDVSGLESKLEQAVQLIKQSTFRTRQVYASTGILPIGVGFLNWGADLTKSIAAIEKYRPCAVLFFGPNSIPDDLPWAEQVRAVTHGKTKIWVQVGTVAEAVAVAEALDPDVLVVQGSDAGGHGLARSASIITLVPEVKDALARRNVKAGIPLLAAGGIVDGRGMAASLALGASGAVMGTRFLASSEAAIASGYQAEVPRASDGGISTVRSTVYDRVRGILSWPARYDGRGIINRSYIDAVNGGMSDEENRALYQEELKKGDAGWGPNARLTTYAGTGVGLVDKKLPAAEVVANVIQEAKDTLQGLRI